MMLGIFGGEAVIRGIAQRMAVLPLLLDTQVEVPGDDSVRMAWSNNWADWDNSGGHNEWEDWNPSPPGG